MSETDESSSRPTPRASVAAAEDFASMFAASESQAKSPQLSMGDMVTGRVIAIGQSSAFIAIGGKGEATMDLAEFRDPASDEIRLAVGDSIEARVVDDGSRSGSIVLKRSMGRGGQASAELEQALELRIPVEGMITGEVKGGFEVQLGNTRAFCPGSQVDRRRGGDRPPPSDYIGKRFQFRVTKVENGGRNVVVSRRDLLDEEAAVAAEKTWDSIRVGAVLKGSVTSVRDFGAFVDLGGVEGMIHVSELGYGRVKHPGDVLTAGQEIEVQVIKLDAQPDDKGRRQIGLSLKALANDPWTAALEQFPVGATVTGTVRRLEAFGAFVELIPGVEGLVHVSKMVLDRRISHPRQVLTVGEPVEITVLTIDAAQRRLSLSMVERARQEQEATTASEKVEEQAIVSKNNQQTSFGSFGDLLTGSRRR